MAKRSSPWTWLRDIFAVAAIGLAFVLFTPLGDGAGLPTWQDITGSDTPSSVGAPQTSKGSEPTTESKAVNNLSTGMETTPQDAREMLDALPVTQPASMAGYERDAFPHWRSATENGWAAAYAGCDAREATLVRDSSTEVEVADDCAVTSGTWVDPYTLEEIADPSGVDIDHVVPLAAAYRAGASRWTEDQATAFANAPANLVASVASVNREKGDKGPEAWAPENSTARCPYAVRWITVKQTYDLSLTSTAERTTLDAWLDACSDAGNRGD